MYTYKTKGTCSSRIDLDIEDGIIKSCQFHNGCSGNAEGVSKLIVGRRVDEIEVLLAGIQCRNGTSCPDQLSRALAAYKVKKMG